MMFEAESQSYYEILDVKPDASQNEIRQAYLRSKAAYSKDSAALYSLFDEQETRMFLDNIEQAYLVLSSPEKRKEYDKIHGFLKANDASLPSTKKTPASSGVFSFGKGSTDAPQKSANANKTMIIGDDFDDADLDSSNASAHKPLPRHDDYSTPRTLAAAENNSSSSTSGEYESPTFSHTENKLGIVRRIDLNKAYEKNSSLEEEIGKEASFRGDFLRRVREYKQISVDEMAEFTKISKTYINCIEGEEFEGLPAPAYLRGFVVQIAKALKLPHDKVANAYMTNYKSAVSK